MHINSIIFLQSFRNPYRNLTIEHLKWIKIFIESVPRERKKESNKRIKRIPRRGKDRQGSRLRPRFFFRQLSLCSPRGVTYFKTRRAKKSSAITQPPIHAAFHEPKRLIHAATCESMMNPTEDSGNPPESSISNRVTHSRILICFRDSFTEYLRISFAYFEFASIKFFKLI